MGAFSISKLWPWLFAITSGLLLALCFPPYNAGGLAFFALVPVLCAVWLKRPARRRGWYHFGLGYVTGLTFFTMTFAWLSELGPLFNNGALRFLSFYLALYLALYPAVWTWFVGWVSGQHFAPIPPLDPLAPFTRPPLLLSTRNLALAITLAAAWTALDWARGLGALSFGWNPLGVALHKDIFLIQVAELTGVYGLSFLLVLCNVIGLITVLRLRAEIGRIRLRPHFDFSLTVALVVVVFSYGVKVLRKGAPKESTELHVVSLQPNVPQAWKLANDRNEEIFERLALLHSYAEHRKPHLTLWPEAAIPGGMLQDSEVEALIRELGNRVPALLLGTDDYDRNANSAAFLLPNQTEVLFYDKQHLVPFGEYLPFRPMLEWAVGGLVPGDFAPGKEPGLFHLPTPGLKIAPLICFEDTVPGLVRRPVQRGADVLINLTNDGWFGRSAGAETHLANAILRTVETRRPLLRCTNTGISGAVDIFGRVNRWEDPFKMAVLERKVQIPRSAGLTFYAQHGDLFALGCLVLAVLVLVGRLGFLHRHRTRGAAVANHGGGGEGA
jgi:apolipoprotein N-acyltransferase